MNKKSIFPFQKIPRIEKVDPPAPLIEKPHHPPHPRHVDDGFYQGYFKQY